MWIDYNSDYKQQADETVTWWLRQRVSTCTANCYFDLVRSVGTSTAIVEAHTIISNVAFTYAQRGAGLDAAGAWGDRHQRGPDSR